MPLLGHSGADINSKDKELRTPLHYVFVQMGDVYALYTPSVSVVALASSLLQACFKLVC